VVAGVIVGAALVSVLVPLFPVGLPLPDDEGGLLALPVPLLSLLPEAPDPDASQAKSTPKLLLCKCRINRIANSLRYS